MTRRHLRLIHAHHIEPDISRVYANPERTVLRSRCVFCGGRIHATLTPCGWCWRHTNHPSEPEGGTK